MKVFLLFLFFTRINAFLHDENDIYKYDTETRCRAFRISGACNYPFFNMFFLPESFHHIECCSSLKDWLLEDCVGRRGYNHCNKKYL
jgi:hypothetical protein